MAEETPQDPAASGKESSEEQPSTSGASQRKALTPELRRFLNTPRAPQGETASPVKPANIPTPPTNKEESAASPREKAEPLPKPPTNEEEKETSALPAAERARPAAPLHQVEQTSRAIEMQHAILIIGAVLLLGLTFYAGTKYYYLKYLITSQHHSAEAAESGPDRFPGVAPEDLVKEALVAQKQGHWQDAIDRLLAAKKKDLRYRGIFLRVANILYDQRQDDAADKLCERAIAFGENVDMANFYRGLIATRRKDLAAAERYLQAAATAAPFLPDYQYYCGEVLRLDLKPKAAIPYYEKAALLARGEQDITVCQFKILMARIEAVDGEAVAAELEKKKAAGPLSVDWLMVSAALQIRGGEVETARQAIAQAREGKAPGLFASCVNDLYFKDVAKRYSELKDVLHLDYDSQVHFPE